MKRLLCLGIAISLFPPSVRAQSETPHWVLIDTSSVRCPHPIFHTTDSVLSTITTREEGQQVFRYCHYQAPVIDYSEQILLAYSVAQPGLRQISQELVVTDSLQKKAELRLSLSLATDPAIQTRHVYASASKFWAAYDIVVVMDSLQVNEVNTAQVEAVPLKFRMLNPQGRWTDTRIIRDTAAYQSLEETGSLIGEAPDFAQNWLVSTSYGGDCMMRVEHLSFFDPFTQTLTITGYNIWGGCRAGGSRAFWMEIPKPAPGVEILFQEVQLESREEFLQLVGR